MSALIPVVIGVVTFAMSVGASAWISGSRWGEIKTDLAWIKRELDALLTMFKRIPIDKDQGRRR